MRIIVDHQDRRLPTGPETGYRFQRESFVGTCLSGNQMQFVLQCLENRFGAAHVAGCTLTYTDDVSPTGVHVEL